MELLDTLYFCVEFVCHHLCLQITQPGTVLFDHLCKILRFGNHSIKRWHGRYWCKDARAMTPFPSPLSRCRSPLQSSSYRVFESFEDNAAWELQLPPACQTADSRNLVPISLENPVVMQSNANWICFHCDKLPRGFWHAHAREKRERGGRVNWWWSEWILHLLGSALQSTHISLACGQAWE